MSKCAIDFGHGVGQDRGANGFIAEEDIINAVGALVLAKLVTLGHEVIEVIEVRPYSCTSVGNSLWQRYDKSDSNNCDWCISIHANASDGNGHGTEVFTYGAKEILEARAILNKIVSLGFTNRGIKDGSNLAMVKRPQAKAMLIEVCFCDTQSDVDKYNSVSADAIANAIVNGLTGQTISTPNGKGYIVTNYLPHSSDTYDGIDISYVLSFFNDVKCYVRGNAKGCWTETSYLDMDKCNELKSTLGSWFYSIEQ